MAEFPRWFRQRHSLPTVSSLTWFGDIVWQYLPSLSDRGAGYSELTDEENDPLANAASDELIRYTPGPQSLSWPCPAVGTGCHPAATAPWGHSSARWRIPLMPHSDPMATTRPPHQTQNRIGKPIAQLVGTVERSTHSFNNPTLCGDQPMLDFADLQCDSRCI
jgi:hypothetical protein